ncbi:hypothetical protein LTR47_004208 [Exophiala xenobiotica]|nr:hypothetical protein LTR47_004208 [Exophiala xenobiotica]KAK5247882.1 hypothetical protein LTS06_006978 [Exophiala xenobiotica]KAK5349408.1 hypothetical protein LTR61_006797 [Exophiala xenobiotica]KAK5373132.1 hypothetical protein LTR11_005871 [Exophiala xenobiotica]KAK5376544.1 hypothetical protein LTS03_005312 [Exophiala xenobiotica]
MSANQPYVLVTGATGFVGAHVVDILLERGCRVRGAARNMKKAEEMRQARRAHADRLDFVQIADFTQGSSLADAVAGVDGIIHVASPLNFNAKDNEKDVVLPAIQGVKSVLQAAAKEPSIKRIVITSSFASVYDMNRKEPTKFTYTEKDWNPQSYKDSINPNSNPVIAYRGSKKFAELEAWNFVRDQKPQFDIVTLCPPMVFAQAHVEALLRPECGNKRYTLAAPEQFTHQLAADIIAEEFEWGKGRVAKSGHRQEFEESHDLDGQRAARDFGITYKKFRDSVVDFVSQAIEMEKRET